MEITSFGGLFGCFGGPGGPFGVKISLFWSNKKRVGGPPHAAVFQDRGLISWLQTNNGYMLRGIFSLGPTLKLTIDL